MPIAIDASTPSWSAVHGGPNLDLNQGGAGPYTKTSDSFTPPDGSTVVISVIVSYNGSNGFTSTGLSCADSLANDYGSPGTEIAIGSSFSYFCALAVFTYYYPVSPGAITVQPTLAAAECTSGGYALDLDVQVLTGADPDQTGAGTEAALLGSTETGEDSITTTATGSWVFIVSGGGSVATGATGCTIIESVLDAEFNGIAFAQMTGQTGVPGPTTLGVDYTAFQFTSLAMLEILPAPVLPFCVVDPPWIFPAEPGWFPGSEKVSASPGAFPFTQPFTTQAEYPVQPARYLIQKAAAQLAPAGGTFSLSRNTSAGSTVYVGVSGFNADGTGSVTIGGIPATLAAVNFNAGQISETSYIFALGSAPAGLKAITVLIPSSGVTNAIAWEFWGYGPDPDVTASSTSGSQLTTWTSGSTAPTTYANALLIGVVTTPGSFVPVITAPGLPWVSNIIQQARTAAGFAEVTATGSYAFAGTASPGDLFGAMIAAFPEAVSTPAAAATLSGTGGGGAGSWVNPGNADGIPDGTYAVWTAPG